MQCIKANKLGIRGYWDQPRSPRPLQSLKTMVPKGIFYPPDPIATKEPPSPPAGWKNKRANINIKWKKEKILQRFARIIYNRNSYHFLQQCEENQSHFIRPLSKKTYINNILLKCITKNDRKFRRRRPNLNCMIEEYQDKILGFRGTIQIIQKDLDMIWW